MKTGAWSEAEIRRLKELYLEWKQKGIEYGDMPMVVNAIAVKLNRKPSAVKAQLHKVRDRKIRDY